MESILAQLEAYKALIISRFEFVNQVEPSMREIWIQSVSSEIDKGNQSILAEIDDTVENALASVIPASELLTESQADDALTSAIPSSWLQGSPSKRKAESDKESQNKKLKTEGNYYS